MVADHLSPLVANLRCRGDRRERIVQRPRRVARVPPRDGRHRPVGDLDATETLLPGELDTASEALVRADHPTAHILGIADAAERHRFELGRSRLSRQIQAPAVLAHAALDIAAREEEIAAQEMAARLFLAEFHDPLEAPAGEALGLEHQTG